jgi:anhydro-N-acetylmuramic acid kinase
MGKLMQALGLMSGTSLDGIDVALVSTDGENRVERGPAMTFPYNAETRSLLRAAIDDAKGLTHRNERPGALPHAERELTEQHAAAVTGFLRKQGIAREAIDVIGFHGQTVLHRPSASAGLTVQLGSGDMLSELTRLPVVFDMRAADVANGGQGAPLVPIYHSALVARFPQRPVAVVNIGGVANVTFVGQSEQELLAFDTGPGNALIDDVVHAATGAPCDEGGALAAQGRVQDDALSALLGDPYFHLVPPKSLDRDAFDKSLVAGLGLEDAIATLTAFTAMSIARSRAHMRQEPNLWIVCGGGRKNKTLMRMIAERVENAVVPAEAVGLDGDSLEAEAWGYLAVRSLRGLPLTYPGTTGVPGPTCGGVHVKPRRSWGLQ